MKSGYLNVRLWNGSVLRLGLLVCLAFVFTGCSIWNPWGYKKEWPAWKKTAFFLGPGHCPVCYCVGGGAIELVKAATGDPSKPQGQPVMVAMAGDPDGVRIGKSASASKVSAAVSAAAGQLPRLVDLGADKCIPCKMMAPILEELKKEYAGKLDVVFIDVWKNPDAGKPYGIKLIPTQIFFDASGKELFRHEGFFGKEEILAKWKELGIELANPGKAEPIVRAEPLQPDTRAKDAICYMCDGDVNPQTRVTLKTDKGDVHLCAPHCFFITWTSLTDKTGVLERTQVTDWATGKPVNAQAATFLIGQDDHHRPTVKAFAGKDAAQAEMKRAGGNLAGWKTLEEKELANRCGFCDRANYPEDAARVKVGTLGTWGCCPMCALGVAARLQKDIEVDQRDALTGEMIHVVTLNGSVASLEPRTAVAWAGQKKGPDGAMVSAGCFKQAFFANEKNLKQWLEQHPTATGKQVSINQALAEKMKLSPEQISKACKIGECAPR